MSVFYDYVFILIVCFLLARLVMWGVSWRLKSNLGEIESAYRTWLIIVVVCLTTVGLGRSTTIVGLMIVALLGLHEYLRATRLYETLAYPVMVYVFTIATSFVVFMSNLISERYCFEWFQQLPWICLTGLLLVPIFANRSLGQMQRVAYAFVGYVYIAWMFAHAAWLVQVTHGPNLLLFLFFSVGIADVAAFTSGKTLGRHRLCSKISPHKTWEGILGSVLVSMVVTWLLRFSFPCVLSLFQIASIGLLIGLGSQFGDLILSMMKRDLGLKDMGAILPGHGGVLDRIDSLILVTPFYYYLLSYHEIFECLAPTS